MEYQTSAISHGIGNTQVSKQWYNRPADERFTSLRDMLAHKRNDAAQLSSRIRNTHTLNIKSVCADDAPIFGDLILKSEHDEQPLNNWSFGQLSQLAGAPAGYLKTLPSDMAADNLMWGLRHNRKNETVKTYGKRDELRAVTSESYGRIHDYQVIENCLKLSEQGDWKIPGAMSRQLGDGRVMYDADYPVTPETTTLFASDRDCFIFLVDNYHPIEIGKLPNGDPDLVFRGFYAWNSEVGSKTAGVAAFYLRGICQNRCLWGVENFQEMTIRHTKNAPVRFAAEMQPALNSFANGSTSTFLEGVELARSVQIGKDEEAKLEFLQKRGGLSKSLARAANARHLEEEGRPVENAWDAVQAITAVARDIPNNDTRLTVERGAGAILDKIAA